MQVSLLRAAFLLSHESENQFLNQGAGGQFGVFKTGNVGRGDEDKKKGNGDLVVGESETTGRWNSILTV
jgi:hypothetical protein